MVIRQLIILLLIFIISGCGTKSSSENNESNKSVERNISKKIVQKKKDITFTLETVDGKTLHIKEIKYGLKIQEFKDRPVFIIMFGYKCPPCLREIPRLIELSKKHKDLAIVAFEVQGLNSSELKDFVESKKINYNVVVGENNMDFITYLQVKSNWSGAIPFLIGVDKKGIVKIIQVGGLFDTQLEYGYRELIK